VQRVCGDCTQATAFGRKPVHGTGVISPLTKYFKCMPAWKVLSLFSAWSSDDHHTTLGVGEMSITQQLVVALNNQMNERMNDLTRQVEHMITLLIVIDTKIKHLEDKLNVTCFCGRKNG